MTNTLSTQDQTTEFLFYSAPNGEVKVEVLLNNETIWLSQKMMGVLQDAGKVTASIAKVYAESEFEKYRIVQDKLYESYFDRQVNKLLNNDSKKKDK